MAGRCTVRKLFAGSRQGLVLPLPSAWVFLPDLSVLCLFSSFRVQLKSLGAAFPDHPAEAGTRRTPHTLLDSAALARFLSLCSLPES